VLSQGFREDWSSLYVKVCNAMCKCACTLCHTFKHLTEENRLFMCYGILCNIIQRPHKHGPSRSSRSHKPRMEVTPLRRIVTFFLLVFKFEVWWINSETPWSAIHCFVRPHSSAYVKSRCVYVTRVLCSWCLQRSATCLWNIILFVSLP